VNDLGPGKSWKINQIVAAYWLYDALMLLVNAACVS